MPLCLALIHSPVVNKRGKTITSSLTNFDIHDIARSCRTFGIERYFFVTPSEPQQWLARRIVHHWREGWGAEYNPNRREALELIEVLPDLAGVIAQCEDLWGRRPTLVGTSARPQTPSRPFAEVRQRLSDPEELICLIFGTAWGLHPCLMEQLDFFLEPIEGVGDYQHLSVRAAVAIVLDRLRGPEAR
jgi:hypothetical protein